MTTEAHTQCYLTPTCVCMYISLSLSLTWEVLILSRSLLSGHPLPCCMSRASAFFEDDESSGYQVIEQLLVFSEQADRECQRVLQE